MVRSEVLLSFGGDALHIVAGPTAWSVVDLESGGKRVRLGAELLDDIVSRLVGFLTDQRPGERWVLSLAEVHTTIYGEHFETGTKLRFQDANASFFSEIVLSKADRADWLTKLRALGSP